MKLIKRLIAIVLMVSMEICAIPVGNAQAATQGTPIYTAEDLLKMKDSSSKFYLANNIDMTEYGLWSPIDFKGTLDGNGYTISNLTVANSNGGMFRVLENAEIQNIYLENVVKKGEVPKLWAYNGGAYSFCDASLAAVAEGTVIKGVHISGSMSLHLDEWIISRIGNVGGIVGYLSGKSKLMNSSNCVSILCRGSENMNVGGLVGSAESETLISNCYNAGNVVFENNFKAETENVYVCGLVGEEAGQMKYCYNIGQIQSECEKYSSTAITCATISSYVLNCYYLEECSEHGAWYYTSSGIEPKCYRKSESELKDKSTYAGWDFDDVWTIDSSKNNGYPILITEQAGEPIANYQSGTYSNEISVCLESSTENATIYYTLDGSVPTSSSYIYYNPITISKTTTLRAITVADGYKASNPVTYKYTYKVKEPKVSLKSGKYQGKVYVKLSCDTDGATIYYTTDGSTPTKHSKKYNGKIKINKNTTLKVIAIKGDAKSKVVTRKYKIKK